MVDDWHIAFPNCAATQSGTTISGYSSALWVYRQAKETEKKQQEEQKKKDEEAKKLAEEQRTKAEQAKAQELRRKLAAHTKAQKELLKNWIEDPREARRKSAKTCDTLGKEAKANTRAGFGFDTSSKASMDFKDCPSPTVSIIDTFDDHRHQGNKAPVWVVALAKAFENHATCAVLVVAPDALVAILGDAGLKTYHVGPPCIVGASYASLRMHCTSGGGLLKDCKPWAPSLAPDGGLLECYLVPVHPNLAKANEFQAGLRQSLSTFDERRLPCGDGREVLPYGCGQGPFVHVTPHSIVCDMAAWVERGEFASQGDERSFDKEPFPLAVAICAFLGLRADQIAPNEGVSVYAWLSAADTKRLPTLYWACLQMGWQPFTFSDAKAAAGKEHLSAEKEMDLY